jgi:hypothetical protein
MTAIVRACTFISTPILACTFCYRSLNLRKAFLLSRQKNPSRPTTSNAQKTRGQEKVPDGWRCLAPRLAGVLKNTRSTRQRV